MNPSDKKLLEDIIVDPEKHKAWIEKYKAWIKKKNREDSHSEQEDSNGPRK